VQKVWLGTERTLPKEGAFSWSAALAARALFSICSSVYLTKHNSPSWPGPVFFPFLERELVPPDLHGTCREGSRPLLFLLRLGGPVLAEMWGEPFLFRPLWFFSQSGGGPYHFFPRSCGPPFRTRRCPQAPSFFFFQACPSHQPRRPFSFPQEGHRLMSRRHGDIFFFQPVFLVHNDLFPREPPSFLPQGPGSLFFSPSVFFFPGSYSSALSPRRGADLPGLFTRRRCFFLFSPPTAPPPSKGFPPRAKDITVFFLRTRGTLQPPFLLLRAPLRERRPRGTPSFPHRKIHARSLSTVTLRGSFFFPASFLVEEGTTERMLSFFQLRIVEWTVTDFFFPPFSRFFGVFFFFSG